MGVIPFRRVRFLSNFLVGTVTEYQCAECGVIAETFCEQCGKPICENCDEYAMDADGCYFHRECWPELFDDVKPDAK